MAELMGLMGLLALMLLAVVVVAIAGDCVCLARWLARKREQRQVESVLHNAGKYRMK